MGYYPNKYGPCMCGTTDCPSCGPAQGYLMECELPILACKTCEYSGQCDWETEKQKESGVDNEQ